METLLGAASEGFGLSLGGTTERPLGDLAGATLGLLGAFPGATRLALGAF